MTPPCVHCPAGPSCLAIARRNGRYCETVDPSRPDYQPDMIPILRGEPHPWYARNGVTPPETIAPSPPSLLDKAVNFAGAAIRHVAHGMPTVDEAEKARRLAICGGCEHFNVASTSCNICGCALKLKASWGLSRCADDPPRW